MTFNKLFDSKKSNGYGLRGDPLFFKELKMLLKDKPLPENEELLELILNESFSKLTENEPEKSYTETFIFVQRYNKGGMSSGCVSLNYWFEIEFPFFIEKYKSLKQE